MNSSTPPQTIRNKFPGRGPFSLAPGLCSLFGVSAAPVPWGHVRVWSLRLKTDGAEDLGPISVNTKGGDSQARLLCVDLGGHGLQPTASLEGVWQNRLPV